MLRIKITSVVLLTLVCQLLLTGCATTSSDRNDANLWITHFIPLEEFDGVSLDDNIPDNFVFLVPESTEADAEAMLRHSSCVKLSRPQVNKLLLKNVNVDKRYHPFLVRGVVPRGDVSYGSLRCLPGKKSLWVEFSEMGHKLRPLRKQPVILFLEQRPQSVFVTYSVSS